jgi:hypothetical protein
MDHCLLAISCAHRAILPCEMFDIARIWQVSAIQIGGTVIFYTMDGVAVLTVSCKKFMKRSFSIQLSSYMFLLAAYRYFRIIFICASDAR